MWEREGARWQELLSPMHLAVTASSVGSVIFGSPVDQKPKMPYATCLFRLLVMVKGLLMQGSKEGR